MVLPAFTGCGSLGTREEEEIGRQFALEAKRTLPFLRDRSIDEFVTGMGQALVKASGPQPFHYRFYVIIDATPNAFAIPGGHIYLHSGAMLTAPSDAELAAVLAHEIGHVVHRHTTKYTDVAWQARYRAIFDERQRSLHNRSRTTHGDIIYAIKATNYLNRFSQEYEMEADRFAVPVLQRAGYDPEALVSFLTIADQLRGARPVELSASHPPVRERIDALHAEIAKLPPSEPPRQTDRERFLDLQRRVRLLTEQAAP